LSLIINERDIRVERLILGPYETNCYIAVCLKTLSSMVVDAPDNAETIIKALNGTQTEYILLTHDHNDHTGTLAELRSRLKAPLAAHVEDSASLKTPPEIFLEDGSVLKLGNLNVEVMHTPGHTGGSVCFKIKKYLFAGDTIFPGGPGRTDSPYHFKQIAASVTGKIFTLPDNTVIYPGHGDSTTVKKSKEEYAVFNSRKHPDDLCGDVLWLSS
jgi:hydroxyacylglutathione hydrolase